MIKKYEIITVGADKRIKALRSFSVQGRYVNVGDVGGIVYDENTLSQGGNAWIFSGNLNYPSIRVGGDSIVDTNGYEGAVTEPRPFVNITGTSALIGAHEFVTGKVSAAKVLAVGDVEQGDVTATVGSKYNESKVTDANVIRLKSLIYMGGISATVTLAGEGYEMKVLRYGADKKLVSVSEWGNSGGTGAANYIGIIIRKTPTAATVPADITAANVTIPSIALESTINIKDSRIEFNYTSAMTVATKVNPSSASSTAGGLNSNITASNVAISKEGSRNGVMNIFADIDHCNVTVSALTALSALIGTFKNVNSLVLNGPLAWGDPSAAVRGAFNFVDCDTVVYTNEVFPTSTITSVVTARMPFTFTRCNVENGLFYHNPVNRNVYTDIDFSKASADLGKALIFGTLCSSEVEGMYRVYHVASKEFGALVERYDSIKDADFSDLATMVATTIYKDAKLTGLFNISGTNVFGGTGNHGGGKGCEITNTKETAMVISGNVRVEGNATVKDVSITGTGYFGGNSVTENAYIFGSAYVTDNGVFSPAPEEGKFDSDIHIEDNARFLAASRSTNNVVHMDGNSEFSGTIAVDTLSIVMHDRSRMAGSVSGKGILILEGNADTSDKAIEANGCIRLVGSYRQTGAKIWTGNRTIGSESEPTYENNVKTKYDF